MPDLPSLEHVAALDHARPHAGLWRRWAGALLDLVFPPFCPVCRVRLDEGRRDPLCGSCWLAIGRIGPPWCRVCGMPGAEFPGVASADPKRVPGNWGSAGVISGPPHTNEFLCSSCRRRAPGFDYARSAARYEDVMREALHAFKFRGRRALAAPLGELLVEAMEGQLPAGVPALLVPVPLHPRRERERGFNQASLLARRVGRAWRVPVRDDVLVRAVATPSQTELDA